MLKADVLKHFGGPTATARALGITRAAIYFWGDVVPWSSVGRVERASGGKLKADWGAYTPKQSIALKNPHAASVSGKHVARKGQS